jgi:integrase
MTAFVVDDRSSRQFVVLRLILTSGERFPCLVDSTTWIPVRVATRWATRFRRLRTQSSTLADNLRILGRLYTWAWSVGGFDLDDYLTGGQLLTVRQIESLAAYLQNYEASSRSSKNTQSSDNSISLFIDPGTYDHQLAVIEEFLKWALYSEHRGGIGQLSLEQLFAERCWLEEIFESLCIGARPSQPLEPLEDNDILAIRTAIGPIRGANSNNWDFPERIFSKHTRLRNWLMFETALQLGIRRGELLKLKLDSIPRGSDDAIVVKRNADDLRDSRVREPAVKTAERAIPASRDLLLAFRTYLTMPPPIGRVRGTSPYLFTTKWGDPLSLDMADDIVQAIGKYSMISPLSWHRFRHTWAEKMAEELYSEPNGMEQLAYLGGWTNIASSGRYIERTKRHHGENFLRDRQKTLYSERDENGIDSPKRVY